MTTGGATSVRTKRKTPTKPHSTPSLLSSDASVILTALAERTRNITEILEYVQISCLNKFMCMFYSTLRLYSVIIRNSRAYIPHMQIADEGNGDEMR